MNDLAVKHIVLGLTGGIACYKAAELCRALIREGATVQVVMTDAAEQFITPVTMQALSNRPVYGSQWDAREPNNMPHINLSREAEEAFYDQTAMDRHMNLVGGNDYYAQASAAFANLKIALAAGGASYQSLVSTTIHIRDIGPVAFEGIQKAMHEAFDGKPIPEHAMTMIGTTLSAPEILLEVSAVAVI